MSIPYLFRFVFPFFLFISISSAQQPNILLVIADDVGVDPVPGYFPGPTKATMPHLEELMNQGITFDNVWANPLCSPTRASILTGKYGFRTNVLNPEDLSKLETDEVVLHQYIDEVSNGIYASSLIGKWHLNGPGNSTTMYPNDCGIPHFSGLLGGAVADYNSWRLISGGQGGPTTEYITTKFTDLAIDWINDQNQPWFCWLAYTAPHTPLHLPPDNMHSQGMLPTDSASIADNPLPYYLAMLESVDYEMGRLLASIPADELENTIVVFIGDNGTLRSVVQQPYNKNQSKGSLYLGGVQVPMVIAGAGVSRSQAREDALINATDLFATIVELTGATLSDIHDSFSFKKLLEEEGEGRRNCIYSEIQEDIDAPLEWTARDEIYKLIKWEDGSEAFFNLRNDPYEDNDLLPSGLNATEQISYDKLANYFNSSCATPIATAIRPTTLKNQTISLYPNPISELLTISGPEALNAPFYILDLLGNVVYSGNLENSVQSLDLSSLAAGVYIFKCEEQIIQLVKAD